MSDELSFREDGVAEMVYVHRNAGDLPWHHHGIPIPEGLTIEEAIILANLGWPVLKSPVQFIDEKGETRTFPDRFVNYRSDTMAGLGIVGSEYHIVQNHAAFNGAVEVARLKGATVNTMGALFGGRCVWCLIELPGDYTIGQEKHQKFLLAYTSHDGSSKIRFKPTDVRVVCWNTVSAALAYAGRELSFAHTADFDLEVKKAAGIFQATDDIFDAFQRRGEEMQAQIIEPAKADKAIEIFARKAMWNGATREELERALVEEAIGEQIADAAIKTYEATVRKKKRLDTAIDLIHARLDEEREGADITAWILAQSMTGWVDHERSTSKGERRFSSLLMGTGEKLKLDAFDVVQQTVAAQAA